MRLFCGGRHQPHLSAMDYLSESPKATARVRVMLGVRVRVRVRVGGRVVHCSHFTRVLN
jgi:hypothetical protein